MTKTRCPALGSWCVRDVVLAVLRRPFDFLVALVLLGVGVWNLVAPVPFPPEVDNVFANVVFRVYGGYLTVGAVLVFVAILLPWHTWAPRVERAGMALLTLATVVMGVLLVHAEPQTVTSEHTHMYLTAATFILATGTFARWLDLSHVFHKKFEAQILADEKQRVRGGVH